MKKGNQLYIDIKIENPDGTPINVNGVEKILFTFRPNDICENTFITKTYAENSDEVIYENGKFKVWLNQDDSFKFSRATSIDARVLYKNNVIIGSNVETVPTLEALSEVDLSA